MSIIVIAEVQENDLTVPSLQTVSCVRKQLDGQQEKVIALLINGNDKQASKLHKSGADKVIRFSYQDKYLAPDQIAQLISDLAKQQNAKLLVAPHSSYSKSFLGSVGAQLNASIATDIVEMQKLKDDEDSVVIKRPVYSGKAFATIKLQMPAIVSVRANSYAIDDNYIGECHIEASDAQVATSKLQITVKEEALGSTVVNLGEASVIVSGGRGIQSANYWPNLQRICDLMGAALGASRAVVDAGWISHSHQVGQTGRTVAPDCYIACGISGAIQHLAGMNSSKVIVAINKDSSAPIFKIATYGIVHDLFEFIPAFEEALRNHYGE